MRLRAVAAFGALLFVGNAMFGVGFSGATWTGATNTTLSMIAAADWTPPTVTVAPLAGTVQGTVTVTATASDARSSIDPASVVVEYRLVGATAWTPYAGCTGTGTNPLTASCSWNTAALPDGDYEVRARASDTAGYATTSAAVATRLRNAIAVKLTALPTYLRGTVAVTGTVVANGGISSGQLFLEDAVTGGSTFAQLNNSCAAAAATTLTCQWDTTRLTDGPYDVRARAVATTTAVDLQRGVVVDNTLPTAAVTVPAGVLSGNVALSATASDATSGVASVDVQYRRSGDVGWTSCTPLTGTYTCSLDTTRLTQGATYDVRAVVTDAAGNAYTTAAQSRVVDNSPATVAVTSPAAGTVLGGRTTVTVNAGSARGIAAVRVEYATSASGPWTAACTAPTAPYSCSWDTTTLSGSYVVRAVATETYGGGTPASAPVAITINNADGSVSVSNPAANAVVSGTVDLTASTVSPTGVTSVALQVRQGTTGAWTTVCTASASPYTCPWSTPAEYNTAWQVQAVMTQGNQRVVTSAAPVNVTVRNIDGTVAVTAPTSGSSVRGTVSLTATAASNAGVTAVRFRRTAPNGTSTECAATGTGPYACGWDTTAITYGSYVITAIMTRGDGSTLTSAPVTVTVDNRVVKGADVQAANGGVASIPDAGDTVTLTYGGLMNLATIQSGLGYGAPVGVAVTLTGSTGQLGDTLAFPGTNLGAVTVSSNFYSNNKTLAYSGSTMTATQGTDAAGNPVTVITVRLGTSAAVPTGERLAAVTTAGTLMWTPSTAATDLNGVACSAAAVTESGAADRDF